MAASNPLEQVTGGPPHAPHVPPIDDVLGPPPRPPTLGGRGHSGLFSPSRAIGRNLPAAHQLPAAPVQRVTVREPKKDAGQRLRDLIRRPDPNQGADADAPNYQAPRGMGRKPANPRNRAQAAQKASSVSQANAGYSTNPQNVSGANQVSPSGHHYIPAAQGGFTTSQRQKRAAGWADIAATMNALRANPSSGGSSGGAGGATNP